MRKLALAMAEAPRPLPFPELVQLARERELFENLLGTSSDAELSRSEKSAFGQLLTRYDHRLVSDYRFIVEGQGRNRRYRVESSHGDMVGHGVSGEKNSLYARELGRKDHSDHSDHSEPGQP